MPGARDEGRPVCLKLLNDSLPENLEHSGPDDKQAEQVRWTGNTNEKTNIAESLHCVYQ